MKTSENIAELAGALVKFQEQVKNPFNNKEAKIPTKGGSSFSYSYSPLDEVLNVVRPLLAANGLSIVQMPVQEEGMIGVTTLLLHKSGEWMESDPLLLRMDRQTAQGAGSAITYARRYSLSSILGIASEDDDDANSIEGQSVAKSENRGSKKSNYTVTEKQINRLYAIAASKKIDNKTVDAAIVKQLNKKAKDLTKKEYDMVCKAYEEMDIEKEPDTQHERSENDYSNEFNDSEELPF